MRRYGREIVSLLLAVCGLRVVAPDAEAHGQGEGAPNLEEILPKLAKV